MRIIKLRHCWLIVTVLLLSTFASAKTQTEVRALEQGKPIERELSGGETHVYSISLTTGQFLHVIVDQRGVDVVVVLFDPEGKQVAEVDSPNGANGPEPLSVLAKTSGSHRIEVRSPDKKARAGRYEVRLEALREATPEDKKTDRIKTLAATLAKVRTEDEGVSLLAKEPELVTVELWKQLNAIGKQQDVERATITFRVGLRIAEQTGHKLGIATSLNNIGATYHRRGDLKPALEYFQRSLPVAEEISEKGLITVLLGNIGDAYNQQGNFAQALEYHQKNLKLNESWGDKAGMANALNSIGLVLRNQGNHTQALEAYQKALSISEATGNKRLRAQLLSEIGSTLFFGQGNNVGGLKYYQQSLELQEALGDKAQIALTLNRIGLVQRDLGKSSEALEAAQRSWRLTESLGNKAAMSDVMMTIGLIYNAQGNLVQALDSYQKSLIFAEEAGVKPLIANAREKIGGIYHSQGKIEEALEYIQKALKLNEELGNKRQIIFSSSALAVIHRSQGNYAQALEYYRKSLRLSEEIGNKYQIATALNGIGIIHSDQGDYAQALEYFQRGLKVREEMGNLTGVQASLNNIGEVYRLRGEPVPALEYYQRSLALAEKIQTKGGIRIALTNIGETYRLQGKYAQAIEYLQKSLVLSEEMGEKLSLPETLISIADVSFSRADYPQSLEFAKRATDLARQTSHREYLRSALTTSARAYRALNQLNKARQSLEEAIREIESLRSSIAGQESRSSYFATVQQTYELYTDLLMQLHREHPAETLDIVALQMNERSRARSLLETLSEAHADIRQGVDPALLQRERTLGQKLNAVGERQTRLLTGNHTQDQETAVRKEIDELTTEFQEVQAQIRQRSPRYAALTQPVPLSLREIQTTVLDADTLLLEYALGEERSYLWAVTPTSINSFELPKRSAIETGVRRAVSLLSDGKQWSTSDKVELEYAEVAGRLSSMLLDPVAAQLKGKRLLIVADGALQYLPFGALPSPKSNVQSPTSKGSKAAALISKPLIVEHEIVSLPSASTLAVLRRETANRARPAKSIAVMADPVFERDDERVTANRTVSGTSAASANKNTNSQATNSRYLLERAFGLGLQPATDEGGATREILRIPRLPFTRREAEAILATAPTSEGMKALDFRASRETAMNPELAQYRIVHFATHGLLNSEHPELSGIVLSLLNETGEPVDGFLRLHEIYNLNLPADLVVLSACQTGLGKEIRGEGLVGLTRGFMYAGSPRVVASLWKVSDAATAELMKNFYRGMLKEKMRPAAALRAAQIEMWKQKRWQAPFYWAAFELQGEWR